MRNSCPQVVVFILQACLADYVYMSKILNECEDITNGTVLRSQVSIMEWEQQCIEKHRVCHGVGIVLGKHKGEARSVPWSEKGKLHLTGAWEKVMLL